MKLGQFWNVFYLGTKSGIGLLESDLEFEDLRAQKYYTFVKMLNFS